MKTQIATVEDVQTIKFNMVNLTVREITEDCALPFIKNKPLSVHLDLSAIRNVDPTGLAWLLNLVNTYREMGYEVKAILSHNLQSIVNFLELSDSLPQMTAEYKLMAI